MSNGYTPTTAQVREGYVANEVNLRGLPLATNHTGPFGPAFDRWLFKVKADVLRETADLLDAMQTRDGGYPRDLPLIIHERADDIEGLS